MEKQIEKLIEAIADDYRRWNTASKKANGFRFDVEEKLAEFKANIEVKKGRKFIKILTERSVWGFINLTHEKFNEGDILKAAGYNAPALNRPRGNIFKKYSVAWTGPHYIAGYSAGGTRTEGLNRGRSVTVNGDK